MTCTNPTPRGVILNEAGQAAASTRWTQPADGAVADLVERFWSVAWDLPDGERFPSSLVPQLSCNLSVEYGSRPEVVEDPVVVTGVPTRRFDVDLAGSGWVFGVKFHPGALAGVSDVPARTLLDRTVPASSVLGADVVAAVRRLGRGMPRAELVAGAERALLPLASQADPVWRRACDLVHAIEADPELTTATRVAACCGLSERSLQRLFARYIGPSPKQVIVRYRLHDAVAALDTGGAETIAELAARLGFYDQAHFAREFTAFVGIPPSRYRAGKPVRP